MLLVGWLRILLCISVILEFRMMEQHLSRPALGEKKEFGKVCLLECQKLLSLTLSWPNQSLWSYPSLTG